MASSISTARPRVASLILLLFLTVILTIGAVPGYWTGTWKWQNPPPVKTLRELQTVRKTGIEIPGWRTVEQRSLILAQHPWSIQQIENDRQETATVFLFTQNGPKDQPQVEWAELNGVQQWEHDSQSQQPFQADQASVTTQIFRAWTQKRTYAVMQWYAWTDGGHPKPSHWFWTDRMAQVRGKRQPWVAVSILVPMEPMGDLNHYRDRLTAIAQPIQTQLHQTVLRPL